MEASHENIRLSYRRDSGVIQRGSMVYLLIAIVTVGVIWFYYYNFGIKYRSDADSWEEMDKIITFFDCSWKGGAQLYLSRGIGDGRVVFSKQWGDKKYLCSVFGVDLVEEDFNRVVEVCRLKNLDFTIKKKNSKYIPRILRFNTNHINDVRLICKEYFFSKKNSRGKKKTIRALVRGLSKGSSRLYGNKNKSLSSLFQ